MLSSALRVGFRRVSNATRRHVLPTVNSGMFSVYLITMRLRGEGCRYCGFHSCT